MKKVTTQIKDKNGKFVTIRAYVDDKTLAILKTLSPEERHQYIVDEHFSVHLNNRRETERHISRYSCLESGRDFVDKSFDMDADLDKKAMLQKLREALKTLTPSQQWLVKEVYVKRRSLVDIAKESGVSHVAIIHRLEKIRKKLKKVLI